MIDYRNHPTPRESLTYATEPFLVSCIRTAVDLNQTRIDVDDWHDLWRIPVLYLVLWSWPVTVPIVAILNRRDARKDYTDAVAYQLTHPKRYP